MADFTIVLPTKRRPDTFRHALATALWQDDPGVEIVVQNNGADPETRAIVDAAADPRIVYDETAEVLPMTANWERALNQASGDWVTYLGDDDGLLPDACSYVRHVATSMAGLTVIKWNIPDYGWPTAQPSIRDLLCVPNVDKTDIGYLINSVELIGDIYKYERQLLTAPTIYCAFTHISLIRRARALYGRYFDTDLPDVHSAIVNLCMAPMFLHLTRPLGVRGVSGHSIGSAYGQYEAGRHRRGEFEADNAAADTGGEEARWQPGLFPSWTLEMVIANALLASKARLFPGVSGPQLDFHGLARAMIGALPSDPAGFAARLADLRRLAELHQLPVDWSTVPAAPTPPLRSTPGFHRMPWDHTMLVIDCARARIGTIADACALVSGLFPNWR